MSTAVRILALLAMAALEAAAAQGSFPSTTEGRPLFARTVPWTEYALHHQNWSVVQRPNGLLYVANTSGVLEYDGAAWRPILLPRHLRTLVRSLAVGRTGSVYVGGSGTIGVLVPDSTGTLVYRPLEQRLPEANRTFSDVWTTHRTDAGIVFQSPEQLMRWDGRAMQVWTSETRFRTAYLVNGTVVVSEDGIGLRELRRDGLHTLAGGEQFAERKVDALLPHPRGRLAIVRDEGLLLIENGNIRPLGGTASAYLTQFRPYTAVEVPNAYQRGVSLYAVSTFGGGIALVDEAGRLVRVYRDDAGLTEGSQATGISADAQGGLWVATQNGLARIDLFPRHTWFDETSGLMGNATTLAFSGGRLMVGTASGLFRLRPGRLGRPGAENAYSTFERVEGVPDQNVWGISDTPHGLLVAGTGGIYVVETDGRVRQLTEDLAFSIHRFLGAEDRALVGLKDGAIRLHVENGRWVAGDHLEGIDGEIRWMYERVPGELWLSEPSGRLFRVLLNGEAVRSVQAFGEAEGLTVSAGPISAVEGRLRMGSQDGVFQLGLSGDQLVLSREPGLDFLSGIYSLFEAGKTLNTWVLENGRFYALRLPGRPYTSAAFELGGLQAEDVIEEARGVVWVAAAGGLLRYDARIPLGERSYPAFIRRVTDRQRRTLFGGAGLPSADGEPQLVIPYLQQEELRFEYAAAFFDRPGVTEYQTRLDGAGADEWSAWGPERSSGYGTLWEGTYTFRVRARDDQGRISEEASFVLRILPPWYRSVWAYALYALLAAGIIWGFSAWRLHKQRLKLEAQRAHSARLERLGNRLRESNVRLRAADKLKDDLLSNTSHELRTPLTAILGFSEMLMMEIDEEQRDLAEGIQRGGKRLLDTVNGLLDMFKLQSGTLELLPMEVDVAQLVRDSVRRLEPLALKQNLALTVRPETTTMTGHIDPDAFSRVLCNLVDNALKFTQAGSVTVLLDGDDHWLYLTVKDTGIGIPAADRERVFRPFEQASTGYSRSHEGTGLGLSIVEQMVQLVGGSLTLDSQEGVGTTVRVILPRWADLALAERRTHVVNANVSLSGLQLLAVGLDEQSLGALGTWVHPQGAVHAAQTTALAVREARKQAYDIVAVAASTPDTEARMVRTIRSIPGYADLPVLRFGGDVVDEFRLRERGFTHHVALPLDAVTVVGLFEELLMHVAIPSDA
jgi:signal transduction histidine kinase/ligand-binding sensor domain-containing protein